MTIERKTVWYFAVLGLLYILWATPSEAQTTAATAQPTPAGVSDSVPRLCTSAEDAYDILSELGGQNIDLYLKRVKYEVLANWYSLVPEEAYLKVMGKVDLEFTIAKDGRISNIKIVCTSGDHALDRAAELGLRSSSPLTPLPQRLVVTFEKRGLPTELKLRFSFCYNPKSTKPTPKHTAARSAAY